jgi:DNA-binding CsgD family transcriptional regulator
MLDNADALLLRGRKLVAAEPGANAALQLLLQSANSAAAFDGPISTPMGASNGDRYVVQILPLTSGSRRKAGVLYSASAAVFVRQAKLEVPHPLNTIAGLYQLTAAEMRVLMMIIEVGGVPDIATALGVSDATVRTHLQNVFKKTSTRRQADLVKLVASYMNPLA